MRMRIVIAATSVSIIAGIFAISAATKDMAADASTAPDLRALSELGPVDTHAHVFNSDPEFVSFLRRLHMHLLDIVVANKDEPTFHDLESKIAAAKAFVKASHGQAALCTTFDPFRFSTPKFAADATQQLNRDFADGAVAVKIWKNIGMELKDESGKFVMPDDPRLQPIYQDIASHGKTLIAHLAEPDSCWLPPNKNSPDYRYYQEHPEWYMFRQPDHPKKDVILRARDHILAQNPTLRVVGAHLGSMEVNLDGLGKRLDRYPNFAVDVAPRTIYLTLQPRDKVRQFILKYQDRILYGTDLDFASGQNAAAAESSWGKQYATDWAFFSSAATVTYQGRQVQGLALPPEVLRKLYRENAVRWIPGILAGSKPQ